MFLRKWKIDTLQGYREYETPKTEKWVKNSDSYCKVTLYSNGNTTL